MPSSDPSGGMRMSVTTTSGIASSVAFWSDGEAVAVRDRLDVRLGVDELAQALADEVVILADDDPDRYAHDDRCYRQVEGRDYPRRVKSDGSPVVRPSCVCSTRENDRRAPPGRTGAPYCAC